MGLKGSLFLKAQYDTEPRKILGLYKARDKAEKFIRSLKEGFGVKAYNIT